MISDTTINQTIDQQSKLGDPTKSYADFKYTSTIANKLIGEWREVENKTKHNRELRYFRNINGEILRSQGLIKADETYTPVKVIDNNIRREQPQYIAYLTQSRRTVIFCNPDGTTIPNNALLEGDFTNKSRYQGWEKPLIKVVDGAQTHAWDWIEIIFDITAPGNFSIEHIGHDRLIFSPESENPNAQEIVLRKVSLTTFQLQELVDKNGFNKNEVNSFISSNPKGARDSFDAIHEVYKLYYREDDVIWVGWWSERARDWFKAPVKLYMGCNDLAGGKKPMMDEVSGQPKIDQLGQPLLDYDKVYESDYPFYCLYYIESENPKITELKGRSELDEPSQEAASAIQSSLTNWTVRSGNIYGSPKNTQINQVQNSSPKQLDTVIKNGMIFDQPMEFSNLPAPDSSIIKTLQTIISINQQENAQINYAALNRPDTEKTATEINTATQESAKLSSIQVTILSIFIRAVYSRCWTIYQNRVAQGKLQVDPRIQPLFYDLDPDTQTITLKKYTIKSSGDVDVIQRAEKLQRMMQFWPVITNTALANEFLKDIVRTSFPEDADRYCAILDQGTQSNYKGLIQKLWQLLDNLAVDHKTNQLLPELQGQEQQLGQLQQEVNKAMQS